MRLAGPIWNQDYWVKLTAVGGKHDGLCAVGVGSTVKKRTRAARLALAASACATERRITEEDPTCDGAFCQLVEAARAALSPPPLTVAMDPQEEVVHQQLPEKFQVIPSVSYGNSCLPDPRISNFDLRYRPCAKMMPTCPPTYPKSDLKMIPK